MYGGTVLKSQNSRMTGGGLGVPGQPGLHGDSRKN